MLDSEKIFADLINFRKEIGAPLCHLNYKVKSSQLKPYRFLIYNPSYQQNQRLPTFHFMYCKTVDNAQKNGTIKNVIRTSSFSSSGDFVMFDSSLKKLHVCRNCLSAYSKNGWKNYKNLKPMKEQDSIVANFNIYEFFEDCKYNSDIWKSLDVDSIPEINVPNFQDINKYRPNHFLLYIPSIITNKKANVFHFMKCKKIRSDERIGWLSCRFTNKTSGYFDMDDGTFKKLPVCPDCFKEWDWTNFPVDLKNNFEIDKFFDYCDSQPFVLKQLKEFHDFIDKNGIFPYTVENQYPSNWNKNGNVNGITTMYRAAKHYRCEMCGVDLREAVKENHNHEILVTHHINGIKSDVRPENMKVLCKWCHSLQPYHSYKPNPNEKQILEKAWKTQGIPRYPH